MNSESIKTVEEEYRLIVTAYYESVGEHDACMYMSSIQLSEAQIAKACVELATGKCPTEIANDLFTEDFLW